MAFGLFHGCVQFFLVEQITDTGIRCPIVVIGVHTESNQSNIDGNSYGKSYDALSKERDALTIECEFKVRISLVVLRLCSATLE